MSGSSPRDIVWDDDSTIVLTSKAESKLLLNAMDENLSVWQGKYADMIRSGLPESASIVRDTRSVIWGHAAVLRKLVLIYGGYHYGDCMDPEECGAGTPDAVRLQRSKIRALMTQIEAIDDDPVVGEGPSERFILSLRDFLRFIQGS